MKAPIFYGLEITRMRCSLCSSWEDVANLDECRECGQTCCWDCLDESRRCAECRSQDTDPPAHRECPA